MSLDLEPVAELGPTGLQWYRASDAINTPNGTKFYTQDQLIAAQVKVLRDAADLLENYYGQGGAGMVRRMADELEGGK